MYQIWVECILSIYIYYVEHIFPNYIYKKMKMLLCVNFTIYTVERCRGYIESFEYDLLMMENWMENSIIFFMFGLEISYSFF